MIVDKFLLVWKKTTQRKGEKNQTAEKMGALKIGIKAAYQTHISM